MSGLELEAISKRFGGIEALADVTEGVQPGELVGLIGPNGAGKSTLVNLVSGTFAPSAGRVRLNGEDITEAAAHRRAKLGVFRTFQTPRLFRRLSVADNVALTSRTTGRGGSARDIERLLDALNLGDQLERNVDSLNIVNRHRIEIARCLLAEPTLLLLDEATAGMTAEEATHTIDVVRSWQAEREFGVLLIEHNLELVSASAVRLFVLNFGRCIARGATADVLKDESVVAAYMGGAA